MTAARQPALKGLRRLLVEDSELLSSNRLDRASRPRRATALDIGSPSWQELPTFADLARRTTEISECHRISGEDGFLPKVHVPTLEALEGVLDWFRTHGQITSSLIVSTPVQPRTPGRVEATDNKR